MSMAAGHCRSVESPSLAQPDCRGSQARPTAPDLSSGGNAFVGSNPTPCTNFRIYCIYDAAIDSEVSFNRVLQTV